VTCASWIILLLGTYPSDCTAYDRRTYMSARTASNTVSGLTSVDKKSVFSGGLPDANRHGVYDACAKLESHYAVKILDIPLLVASTPGEACSARALLTKAIVPSVFRAESMFVMRARSRWISSLEP